MRKGNTKRFCKKGHDLSITERDTDGRCKPCRTVYLKSDKYQKAHKLIVKKWLEDNKEYKNTQIRKWIYKNKFGITIEQYDRMLVEQNNSCAVCERPQANFKKKLSLDHDHKTS